MAKAPKKHNRQPGIEVAMDQAPEYLKPGYLIMAAFDKAKIKEFGSETPMERAAQSLEWGQPMLSSIRTPHLSPGR